MKKMVLFLLLIAATFVLIGCGETVNGAAKDVNRMGKGINTFFFRQ